MKYRKKPVVIEAFTFEEVVAAGLSNADSVVDGAPWAFDFHGHRITHERDGVYLVPTLEGMRNFTPDDMLIIGTAGEMYPCKKYIFDDIYEPVDDVLSIVKIARKLADAIEDLVAAGGIAASVGAHSAVNDAMSELWVSLEGPEPTTESKVNLISESDPANFQILSLAVLFDRSGIEGVKCSIRGRLPEADVLDAMLAVRRCFDEMQVDGLLGTAGPYLQPEIDGPLARFHFQLLVRRHG